MNRIITSVVILAFVIADANIATAQVVDSPNFSRVFQRLTIRSIVKIHDRTDGTQGSGFVIGRDDRRGLYIMTCAHVADRGHRLEIDLYPHGSIDVSNNVEIFAHDERRDMAVIRVRGVFDVLPLPIAARPRTPGTGTETFIAGFPDGKRTCSVTTILRRQTVDGRDNLYLRSDVGPGASGSPVFACHGENSYTIVGVYWGHSGDNGIATVDVHAFLREHSLHELQNKLHDEDIASAVSAGLEVLLEELAERP